MPDPWALPLLTICVILGKLLDLFSFLYCKMSNIHKLLEQWLIQGKHPTFQYHSKLWFLKMYLFAKEREQEPALIYWLTLPIPYGWGTEVRSRELNSGLLWGQHRFNYLTHHCCLPRTTLVRRWSLSQHLELL